MYPAQRLGPIFDLTTAIKSTPIFAKSTPLINVLSAPVIAEKPTAREPFDEMTRRYRDRLNPGTVWLNAQRLG